MIDLAPDADGSTCARPRAWSAGRSFRWRDRPGLRALLRLPMIDARSPATADGRTTTSAGVCTGCVRALWSAGLLLAFLALSGLNVLPMVAVFGVASMLIEPITRRRLVQRHLGSHGGRAADAVATRRWTPEQRTRVPAAQMLACGRPRAGGADGRRGRGLRRGSSDGDGALRCRLLRVGDGAGVARHRDARNGWRGRRRGGGSRRLAESPFRSGARCARRSAGATMLVGLPWRVRAGLALGPRSVLADARLRIAERPRRRTRWHWRSAFSHCRRPCSPGSAAPERGRLRGRLAHRDPEGAVGSTRSSRACGRAVHRRAVVADR